MMAFCSVLFDREEDAAAADSALQPACFGDLHLDQIVSALTNGRDEYRLQPLFFSALHSVESVHHRHAVLGDLQREEVMGAVHAFADRMVDMRRRLALAGRLREPAQRQRWFLGAGSAYCDVVNTLGEQLAALDLHSAGFRSLRDHVTDYVASDAFASLDGDTRERLDELSAITYSILIRGMHVRVSGYQEEPDMSEEVQRAFAKFQQGAVHDYTVRFREAAEADHVEAQVLERVAKLFPEAFGRLAEYCTRHEHYLDETIARFDREVQFYLAYLQYIAPLTESGLTFSAPEVSDSSRNIAATATFDLSLAAKLVPEHAEVVCNDLFLSGPERILVVSGPNNGGKTTFARMVGQLAHLAALGLPVPGRDTRLFLPDRVFTHFEREEDIETLRGKFEDELFRIHAVLAEATGDSLLIMNESFGSTTLQDAVTVGTRVMRRIIELGPLCVFVTFVDELSTLGDSTVSMMSTVVADDPAVRTFKVVRKPADGLAYAAALADKYGLTTDNLRRRIAR
jgi:hypothetical protein